MSKYGYLPHGHWSAASSSDHRPQWCDGRYIWVFGNPNDSVDRFDTETLYLEMMGGSDATNGSPSADSHALQTAEIAYDEMSHVAGDDDFIYWLEPKTVNGSNSDARLGVLRRMSLNEPYYVERVDNGWDDPDGYTAGSGNAPFYGLDNCVYVDSRVIAPKIVNGLAVYLDYLYFTNVAFSTTGDYTYRICRWPLAGGDIEVLYEVPEEGLVTGNSNVDEVRGGAWSYPYHGMGGPDLEGLDFSDSTLTVVDDFLIMHNKSTSSISPGRYPNTINVAFNIPELLTVAPLTHDRANPWYTAINNGTGNFESLSSFNYEVWDRYYAMRDGSQPLIDTHLVLSGTAGRGDKRGSFYCLSTCRFFGLAPGNADNLFIHKLSYIERGESNIEAVWDVALKFEGKALQGYGRQVILHGKEAPKEVVLE